MIGTAELVVILCIVLLLFGGKRLPEVARSLGKGIREFKKATSGDLNEHELQKVDNTSPEKNEESHK